MTTPSRIGCIMLAAGSSRRFGTDKRKALLADGRSLLVTALGQVPPIFFARLLVLRPGDEALAADVPAGWEIVYAAGAEAGMSHSLAAGLLAAGDWQGAVVALADMPRVQAATFTQIAAMLKENQLVVPRHSGRRGNPVGIGNHFFASLADPSGDQGARDLFSAHPEAIRWVDVEDAGILQDVDSPEQL